MTIAPDADPYLVPPPTPHSPVVLADRAGDLNAHISGHYRDMVWSLAPLTNNPSAHKSAIHWKNAPQGLREELRLVAWTMINGQLRPSFLAERRTALRSRLSAAAMNVTILEWFKLARWLAERGIETLADCDESTWELFGKHVLARGYASRDIVRSVLAALTRLWAFDQLSACPVGVRRPPWDSRGIDDYLPAESATGGENATEPLAEQTLGPLLIWAMRVVDDIADDILAAWTQWRNLKAQAKTNKSTPQGAAAVRAYFDWLIGEDLPVPAMVNAGRTSLAITYVAALTGASTRQVQQQRERLGLTQLAASRPGPCPLDITVKGRLAGKLWRDRLDFNETPSLVRHLGTAAFIVCAYLTGMRIGEILGLRSGCCPDPAPDATGLVSRHLIRSHQYKTATDEDGNHHSAGVEREVPWVAITPVVNAIRVLERMVPAEALLFDHNTHDLFNRPDTGSLKSQGLRTRIEDFVTFANAEAASHHRSNEVIPADPHGPIGIGRFRRSLAWHIARRPNGLVALAIQYGHMRTIVTEGYAARGRGGIHELVDIETARAVADTAAKLRDDLDAGSGVSGPAARRAIQSAVTAARFEGVTITARSARLLLANEQAVLYDNPQALLLCHYKRERALCHRDGAKDTPSLDRCIPTCGNAIRTDQHATALRRRADTLDDQAAHTPGPLGDRLRATAAKLRNHADAHDKTRITLKDEDTE